MVWQIDIVIVLLQVKNIHSKVRKNPIGKLERRERVCLLKELRVKLGRFPKTSDVLSYLNIDIFTFSKFFKRKKYRVERRCHVFYEKRIIAKMV